MLNFFQDNNEMLCDCKEIPKSRITELAQRGLGLTMIIEETDASMGCGSCYGKLKKLVKKSSLQNN